MLRFLTRALGLIALVAAFASAIMDGARSIANNGWSLTPLGTTLAHFAPAKSAQLPIWAAKIHPKLWDPLLIDVLFVPTSVALAGIGVALVALASVRAGRRR